MLSRSKPRRRYPMRVLLVTLIGSLLTATVTTVGAVAFFNLRESIDELFESQFKETSRAATERVQALLEPALALLRECNTKAQRGLWRVDDHEQLGIELVERLRYQQTLTWLSYGDEQGRFAGARRDDKGNIILNRSWINPDGTGRMEERIIHPDGTWEKVREKNSDKESAYDPRQRPFYQIASATTEPAWTEPYPWWDNEGLGITCCIALREDGKVRGVFTADFRLDSVADFLGGIPIGKTGQAFIVNSRVYEERPMDLEGRLVSKIAEPRKPKLPRGVLQKAIASLPGRLSELRPGNPKPIEFEFEDQDFAAAFEAIPLGEDIHWVTVVIVPQRELLGKVWQNTAWTIAIGGVSLVAALVLGNFLSTRFVQPLKQISDDLERVGHFDLSSDEPPQSPVREIQIVGETAKRMKASLRSFARYVPTDVVRQLLARGDEARLGARPEMLTICFLDIEGFSKISERTEPKELVETLGVYFDAVSNLMTAHGATLDKFIGDGLLAFFNAPNPIPDHPISACHAALSVQQALRKLNAYWEYQSKPTFRTRIGLHTAEVLVGNIGTPSRFAYTVVGDGVNLADALEALNKVYGTSILASEEVRNAGASAFEWRRIDRVAAKGRAKGGFIYELLGVKGTVPADVLAARDLYEQAFDAYLQRRFYDAISGFHETLDKNELDRAAQVLLTRCRVLAQSPPPTEWNGVYVHTQS